MSQGNVEIVRGVNDAFQEGVEHGDFTAGFATGLVSEDSELVAPAEYVEERSYRGRRGIRRVRAEVDGGLRSVFDPNSGVDRRWQ